jgi:hypothetical protein
MNATTTPTTAAPLYVHNPVRAQFVFDFTISRWRASASDKEVSAEVTRAKGAANNAAKVQKDLMKGEPLYKRIEDLEAAFRRTVRERFPQWGGTYRLPAGRFLDIKRDLIDKFEREYGEAIDQFCEHYATLISKSAFTQGEMFKREDYPTPEQIRSKFGFSWVAYPVPQHDRMAAEVDESLREVVEHFEAENKRRTEEINRDAWNKLAEGLRWAAKVCEGGRVFETSVERFAQLTTLLSDFNVTGDLRLEAARLEIETLLAGSTSTDALTETMRNPALREPIKQKVNEMLSALDF